VTVPSMHCYLMADLVHKVSPGISVLRIFTAHVIRVPEVLFYLVVFINFVCSSLVMVELLVKMVNQFYKLSKTTKKADYHSFIFPLNVSCKIWLRDN